VRKTPHALENTALRVQEDRCCRPGLLAADCTAGGSSGSVGGIVAARSAHGVAARGTSAQVSIVTAIFLPSAWLAKGFNCRPSGLVKLDLGEQPATQGSGILAGRYPHPHPHRPRLLEASPLKGARRIAGWIRPQVRRPATES
jgi:hypothetical protein